jgi:hypothetical protein
MTGRRTADRLSADEVQALRFAAHRQLARWADNPELSPRQHVQRGALTRAVRILQDRVFADGCELGAHAAPHDARDDVAARQST